MTLLSNHHRHLTEDQMHSLLNLSGGSSGDVERAHLATCIRCEAEFTTLAETLSDFRIAATSFAASTFRPPTRASYDERPRAFSKRDVAWSLAAAVLAAGTTIPFIYPNRISPKSPHEMSAPLSPGESDEALLQAIHHDLTTSVPPSLQPLSPGSDTGRKGR